MKLSRINVDADAQVNGIWRTFGEADGLKFECKIASVGTKHYRKLLERKRDEAGFAAADVIPEEVNERLTIEAIAEGLLLDWRGLQDDEGKEIKYTLKRAVEYLADPELQELREFVVVQAAARENFKRTKLEKAAKN